MSFDFEAYFATKLAKNASLALDGSRTLPLRDFARRAGLLFRFSRAESRAVLRILEQRGLARRENDHVYFLNVGAGQALREAAGKQSGHGTAALALVERAKILNVCEVAVP